MNFPKEPFDRRVADGYPLSSPDDLWIATKLTEALALFEHDGDAAVDRLAPLYDPDVVFRDPLQTLHGRDALLAMNRRIQRRARTLSFGVSDVAVGPGTIFVAWKMLFVARRGPTIVFDGATRARTRDGRIVEQQDYWDLLSSVAQSLPILREVYASLAPRLG